MIARLEQNDVEKRSCVTSVIHSMYSNNVKSRSELRQLFGTYVSSGCLTIAALLDTLFSYVVAVYITDIPELFKGLLFH